MAIKNKNFENFLFSVGGVIAMFVLLAGIYVLSHVAAKRIDLTEEKMFTLSDGTKAILKKLDTPVQIRYYVSQGQEQPGGNKFTHNCLPCGDGHGQQQFHGAHPPLLGPQAHPRRRDEEKI